MSQNVFHRIICVRKIFVNHKYFGGLMSRMYEHRIFIFSGVSLAFLATVCVAEPRVPTLAEPVEEEENNREGKGNLKI